MASGGLVEQVHTRTYKVQPADDLADVKASIAGDQEAYRRIVQRYQAHVARIMWRFTRVQQLHEELVQEVFVQAYLSLRGYRARSGLASWLTTVATRVGYRYWRQTARHKEQTALLQADLSYLTRPQQELSASEAASLVHRLLAQLPPRDRLVLTLRFIEGYSVEQTARHIGWSTTMVKVQTLRAKRKLATLLARYEKETLP